ncbi:MAG: VOC family protein [Planctomycetes bacterium]|nr:VOC family protein [Planctomycetota bacterium]
MTTPAPVCHIVIPSKGLKATAAFYEGVFGWRVDWAIPAYPFWHTENVSGAFSTQAEPALGVLLYLKVDDIDAALKAIEAAGGRTLRPKEQIGEDKDLGFDARFADPSGNELGLWSAD